MPEADFGFRAELETSRRLVDMLDLHLEVRFGQGRLYPFGPFDHHYAARLNPVVQPQLLNFIYIIDSIRIHVHERSSTGVRRHQRKSGALDGAGINPQAGRDSLYKSRLTRSQSA